MDNVREEILDELSKNRDYYKERLRPIQMRRNAMYQKDPIEYWDEINSSYETALFVQLFDDLSEKLDLPVDELYIELESINLSEFFEPSN